MTRCDIVECWRQGKHQHRMIATNTAIGTVLTLCNVHYIQELKKQSALLVADMAGEQERERP